MVDVDMVAEGQCRAREMGSAWSRINLESSKLCVGVRTTVHCMCRSTAQRYVVVYMVGGGGGLWWGFYV